MKLRDGSFLYPTAVWRVFRERPEILRYQLVQHARDRFELRAVTTRSDGGPRPHGCRLRFQVVQDKPARFRLKVVVADDDAFARASTAVVRALADILQGATVDVERHEELSADASGKFRTVVAL